MSEKLISGSTSGSGYRLTAEGYELEVFNFPMSGWNEVAVCQSATDGVFGNVPVPIHSIRQKRKRQSLTLKCHIRVLS